MLLPTDVGRGIFIIRILGTSPRKYVPFKIAIKININLTSILFPSNNPNTHHTSSYHSTTITT